MKEKGFTLIELLIVISVIAILASIIIPNFRAMQEEGKIVAAQGDLNTLKTALESYHMHNQEYPKSLEMLEGATPKIIDEVPKDRFNPKSYYNYSNLTGYYIVWSNGPNGKQDYTLTSSDPPKIDKSSCGGVCDDIIVTNLSTKK